MIRIKWDTEKFIKKSNQIHNNKYDYSLVDYVNMKTKIEIICPKHGIFKQTPNGHLSGRGCYKCNANILMTKEEYVERCIKIHGDKYDYSNTIYVTQQKKINVFCKIHGEFEQWAQHHLKKGVGCPKCAGKIDTKDFIKISNEIHNNKYDYSKTVYVKSNDKVIIVCPHHGDFEQKAYHHTKGVGCPRCAGLGKTNEEIKEIFKNIHNDEYDYSKLDYTGPKNSLIIICKKHGEFRQMYNTHLKGIKCPRCSRIYNTIDFIEKSKIVHNDKYDYSKTEYVKSNKKVIISCPIHKDFLQIPNSHLLGYGCPKCNSSKGEISVEKFLMKNNINYETQKKFENCRNVFQLSFDFYLPEKNLCIEFDGKQHYEKFRFEKNDKRFNDRKKRDQIKTDFCLKNDIKLIRIKYDEIINDKLRCLID
jgi:very-short-patch-repair endonuclease